MSIKIRQAEKKDCAFIREMIMGLAIFEQAPDEVTITLKQLEDDGFSDQPIYYAIILSHNNVDLGFALYYYRYSTWKGKTLYLEDLYITDGSRSLGLGLAAFKYLANVALEQKCYRFEWQVLDWNERAINFYKKFNTQFLPEWVNCRLEGDKEIRKLLEL